MKRVGIVGSGLAVAYVAVAMFAGSVSAYQYELKGLPELGRCVRVPPKHGNYMGANCISSNPGHGKYEWLPGAGETLKKFTLSIALPTFQSTGKSAVQIACGSGTGEGEYTGEKSMTIKKLLLEGCKNPAVAGEKAYCQKTGSTSGEIEATELYGEIGFIVKSTRGHPGKKMVGMDLVGTITFECEGAVEDIKKGLGTGTAREITGSVIGKVTSTLNRMVSARLSVKDEVKSGAQSPESFEGIEKDTLTTLVGTEKVAEPTLLTANEGFTNEQSLEIKAKCRGSGC
jgi:hypothetical protein